MAQAVEEWYKQMPIITRSYLTAAIVTTIGCSLEVCAFFFHLMYWLILLVFVVVFFLGGIGGSWGKGLLDLGFLWVSLIVGKLGYWSC